MRVIFRAVRAGARLACDTGAPWRADNKPRQALGRAAGHLVVVDENVIAAEGLQVMGEALAVIEGRVGELCRRGSELSMAPGADEQAKDALFLLVVEPDRRSWRTRSPAQMKNFSISLRRRGATPEGFRVSSRSKALLEAHEDAAPPTRAGFGLRRGQHVERSTAAVSSGQGHGQGARPP